MLPATLSRLWSLIRRRSPRQHLAALRKRLAQAQKVECAAVVELTRLRGRRGETRAIKWAARRLTRLRRRTDRLSSLVEAAELLVK